MGGSGYDLTPSAGGTTTFPNDEKPYGASADARPVFYFAAGGYAKGDSTGLPQGSANRTIMSWVKRDNKAVWDGAFGYGSNSCNQAYYLDEVHNTDPEKNGLTLDQFCQNEGLGGTFCCC